MITSGGAFACYTWGVFGLARSGRSVAGSVWASGADAVWAWDDNPANRDPGFDEIDVVDLNSADLSGLHALVVSPGVPLNSHPLVARARAAGVPVVGDIELFSRARHELPPAAVVGITGTNGKSTTAALLHHIVRVAGRPTLLGGNIGAPILGEEPLREGGVYVLELSSFQIDLTFSLACDVAILLNITPDHLDRYDGMDGYAASKARLFAMQRAEQVAVIATDDDYTRAIAARVGGRVTEVSAARVLAKGVSVVGGTAYVDGAMFGSQSAWPALAGPANAQNAAAAIAAARAFGLGGDAILTGLASYPGLAHRMETVAVKRGVRFVNDSKATNPTSVAPALAAYEGVHWIAGGQAKTDELDALAPHLAHVRAVYLIGEAAELFAGLLGGCVPVVRAGTLARAVAEAAAAARPGETVLLSPACASFDQFANYEARGDAFRAAVEAL